MRIKLDTLQSTLQIQQKIKYINTSTNALSSILLHDWSNSFRDNETPLAKRFVEDYKREFYFSEDSEKGYTKIHNLTVNNQQAIFKELKNKPDVLKISLNNALQPNDSLIISATYTVKTPDSKFTGYGKTETGYHLRYWYLTPAVYKNGWQAMSNLNLDDLFEDVADFSINIDVPSNYVVESNLYQHETKNNDFNNYYLIGKKKKDIILQIDKEQKFKPFQTKNTQVKTDIFDTDIDYEEARDIIKREVAFIEDFIGKHPHVEILIDASTVNKNTLQEIYGLPNWLKPYPKNFRWEMRFFKALTTKFIDDILLVNKRKEYWLNDGIQTFLMMEYLKKYYPDLTVFGKFSKVWGFRGYNLAKLKQSDKFAFLYQFSARKFYDQSLTTRADSLSNFNRKVVSQYKSGLGFKYLQDFVGDSILKSAFQELYRKKLLKTTTTKSFEEILKSKSSKNLNWFFGDFIKTNKKIDYTIEKAKTANDSIEVTIKNKRDITAPVALYGVKDKEVKFKKWITNIDSTSTIKIPKGDFDRIALNYENIYPEYNTLDNFKSVKKRLLNKPIQFRFLKDVENPYYNQIYFQPEVRYNYYDGLTLVSKFHNKPIIARNLELNISPAYATKRGSLTGGFNFLYNDYASPESSIYRTVYGVSGSYQHYQENLAYKSFSPYVVFQFKRNSLRDVGGKSLAFNVVSIDKEVAPGQVKSEEDNYSILGIRYFYSKPNAIKGIQYTLGTQIANNFSKLTAEFRYRELTGLHRRMEFRAFAGVFLTNDSTGDYFSFGLDRANDYLFQLGYYSRSEDSGIFSQQFILAEGGFKSKLNTSFANQYMLALNSSVGIWRWVEVYNDVAFLKNRNKGIYTAYENGIRLNFVPNIFELYFPIYSNNGWEVGQHAYPKKIRFVLTANINAIYNFVRRGFL